MNGLLKHLFTGWLLLCFIQLTAQPTFSISPTNTLVDQNNSFTVDVRVSNFTNVASIQFPITWNDAIIDYQAITNINSGAMPGLSMSSFGVPGSGNAPDDQIVLSWNHPSFSGVTLADETTLFSITFQGVIGGTSIIEFNENLPQSIEILDPGGNDLGFAGNNGMVTVNGSGGPTGFTLTLADINANQNDNVCLPMTVNDFDNILGMQFSVNYDASALTYTGAQNFNASLLGWNIGSVGQPMPQGPLSPGNLTFTWNDPQAAGASLPNGATLVELCFDVTGSSTTTVTFSGSPTPIEVIDGNEMPVTFSSESGTVTVGGGGGPMGFTLTLADVNANQNDNVCLPMTVNDFNNILGMQFSVNYDASALTYTGAQNFNASLLGWNIGSVGQPMPQGPLSPGNLTFTWNDPQATGASLPNGATLVELCFDVTGSSTTTVTFSGSPTPIEIIDGNEMPVAFSSESGTVTVGGGGGPMGFTLILADVNANQNDNVCLPMTVNDFDNILGMQFSVNYDASALTYTGAQNFNASLLGWNIGSVGQPMPQGPLSPGNLTFTWNDPQATGASLPDGATLVELCFDVTGSTTTTVTFSGSPTPIEVIDGNEMPVAFNSDPGVITIGGTGPMPITLTLADVTAMQGDNICLPLTVTNFTDIQSMQFSINYDPSILSFTAAQNFNASLPGWGGASITNPSAGVLSVSWSNASGITLGNGSTLVQLCFSVTGNTTTNVNITGSPTPINIQNGDGPVTTNSNSGTVTISTPIEGFTLILGDATAMMGDNVCLPMTVNDFDNILGMQFSINYDASALTYTGAQNFNASLLGWNIGSVGQPMPQGPLSPGNLTFTWNDPQATGASLPNGTTLVELCFDVNTTTTTTVVFSGTPTPIEIIDGDEMTVEFNSDPGVITIGTVGPMPITLTLADVTAMQGDNICLPLTVTNFTDIQSMQFSINYDPSILSFTAAQNFNASLPGWGGASITNPSAGVLSVSWSNASGITLGNGSTLVQLCFSVTGNTTTNVNITGSPTPINIQNGDGPVTTNTDSGTVTISTPIEGFTLILGDATAMMGDNVCLPMTVNDFDNILGMQFSINYDASALTYTGAQNFNASLLGWNIGSVGQPMPQGPLSPGNLTFTWNDPQATGASLPNGATLVELCFDVNTTTTTTVVFSGTPTPIEIIDGDEMTVEFNSDPGVITIGTVGPMPITLALGDVTTMQGANICLPLTVTNFTDVQSMQFSINYDPSILSFTAAQNFNASLPGWSGASITNPSAGVLSVSWSNASGITLGNGSSLVQFCFSVIGNTTTTVNITGSPTPISIQNGDGPVTTNTDPGIVSINPPIEGFTLILGDATVMTGDNVCLPMTVNDFDNILGMQFSVNYDASALTYTGAQNFNASLLGWNIGSVGQPMPQGPLSPGNLTFTWNDPQATGASLPDGATLVELCFDVNTTTTTTVVFSGTPTPIEIIDGDEMTVEFNSDPGVITIGTLEPGVFAINIPTVEACMGADFCLDVTASMFTNIQGMQFSINYNTADLSFTQVSNLNSGLPGLSLGSFNSGTPGTIILQWNSSTGSGADLNPNAVLFSLCFNKVSNNNTSVSISGTPTAIAITDGDDNPVAFNGITGQVTCDPPMPLEFGQVDIVHLVCADDPIGSITIVNMVNGSGSYTYQWAAPIASQTGATVSGLGAGNFTVTVTDTGTGMTASNTFTVTSPPALTGSVVDIVNVLCAGDSSGSIEISGGGGVPLLSYDWSGSLPDNVTEQNNLPEGTYSVTITDQNNCTLALQNIQINELADPIELTGNVSLIPGTGAPGGIDLTVEGGMAGYNYSWTGPNGYTFGAEDPNDIMTVGEYCVTVTDAFGCTMTSCYEVYEVLRLTFFTIDEACPGESNGGIDITVAGGNCPSMNTYNWTNLGTGQNVGMAEDLPGQPAGTYRVVVMDCAGSSISIDITIGENDPIVINGTATDVMVLNDGSVTLSEVSGGSGVGYTYSWVGPTPYTADTRDISNLAQGTYCVTVTDDAGCTATTCFTVNSAPLVINQQVPTGVSCNGDMTGGSIFLAIGGGQHPMILTLMGPVAGTYNVPSDGQITIPNLAPGNYTFTIVDSGVGSVGGEFIITEPAPIMVTNATVINDTADPGGSGSISIILAEGGTGTLDITWFGYPPGPQVIGITGPTTVVGTITDDNGCDLTISYNVGELVVDDVNITDAGCTDSTDGAITVTPGGGSPDYTYSWTAEGNPVPFSMDPTITGLSPNTYILVLTDASGATMIRNYEIGTQSDFAASAMVITELDCFDSVNGALLAQVQNNGASTNFDYELELDGAMVGTNSTGLFENFGPGDYTVYVVDNFMCEDTTTVSLIAPEPVGLSSAVKGISCDGREDGEIGLSASGGSGSYTFMWSTGTSGSQLVNLAPGTYTVTATDSNGCSVIESFEIEEATPLIVTIETTPHTTAELCNGSVTAVVLGGSPPYSYEWLNIPGNPDESSIQDLCNGTYMLQVTDSRGCSSDVVAGIVVDERFECFEERVVITPDGNGSNDEFIIFCAPALTDNHLEIYNRWGQLVFQTDNYDNTWEGTSQNGDNLPAGPYYWVLDYFSTAGEPLQQRGSLTIVRDN